MWHHRGEQTIGKISTVDYMVQKRSNLHLPGGVASQPLRIDADSLLSVSIESDRAKVDGIREQRVAKEVFDAVEGVAIEQEHRFTSRMTHDADCLDFPVRDIGEQLDSTAEGLRCGE